MTGDPKDWHRRVAEVAGTLSLAIVRRAIRPETLVRCAEELEIAAREMRSHAARFTSPPAQGSFELVSGGHHDKET
jgi:hypothetical protein